jgi:hypothetical protein
MSGRTVELVVLMVEATFKLVVAVTLLGVLLVLHFTDPATPTWCTTNLVHWWQPQPDDPITRQAFCR